MDGLQISPLKAPVIEIIDLSSKDDSDNEEKRDNSPDNASLQELEDGDDDDHQSLYEDMLEGMLDRSEWDEGMSCCNVVFGKAFDMSRTCRYVHGRRSFRVPEATSACR